MDGEPIKGIDPSVLEHNGAVYYTWGQGHCHMAKLNDDMCSLDVGTYAEAIVSSEPGEQGFHEGSSLRKIGDWFCMVYASEYKPEFPNRGSAPTKLDYAVSKDIYGPYERRGTIINNFGIDPQSWNNHGSILKIKDQWYVCYHGSSNNCKYTRRARIAKIHVDEVNGYIEEAEMTSVGFGDVINPLEGFDVAAGITNCGSKELFVNLLGDFYKLIDQKSTKIEKCLADGMLRDYTIEVHALKNTARMIGALELSEKFYRLEQLGNANEQEILEKETPDVLELYRSYKPVLEPYGRMQEQDKQEVSADEMIHSLEALRDAVDSFDLDGADAAMHAIEGYAFPENLVTKVEELDAYVADVAMEEILNLTEELISELKKLQ